MLDTNPENYIGPKVDAVSGQVLCHNGKKPTGDEEDCLDDKDEHVPKVADKIKGPESILREWQETYLDRNGEYQVEFGLTQEEGAELRDTKPFDGLQLSDSYLQLVGAGIAESYEGHASYGAMKKAKTQEFRDVRDVLKGPPAKVIPKSDNEKSFTRIQRMQDKTGLTSSDSFKDPDVPAIYRKVAKTKGSQTQRDQITTGRLGITPTLNKDYKTQGALKRGGTETRRRLDIYSKPYQSKTPEERKVRPNAAKWDEAVSVAVDAILEASGAGLGAFFVSQAYAAYDKKNKPDPIRAPGTPAPKAAKARRASSTKLTSNDSLDPKAMAKNESTVKRVKEVTEGGSVKKFSIHPDDQRVVNEKTKPSKENMLESGPLIRHFSSIETGTWMNKPCVEPPVEEAEIEERRTTHAEKERRSGEYSRNRIDNKKAVAHGELDADLMATTKGRVKAASHIARENNPVKYAGKPEHAAGTAAFHALKNSPNRPRKASDMATLTRGLVKEMVDEILGIGGEQITEAAPLIKTVAGIESGTWMAEVSRNRKVNSFIQQAYDRKAEMLSEQADPIDSVMAEKFGHATATFDTPDESILEEVIEEHATDLCAKIQETSRPVMAKKEPKYGLGVKSFFKDHMGKKFFG